MKVSKAQVEENRRAILDAAGRLFRERGLDEVSVSEVMTAAGLTHGAFYGYFRSKDDLVAATLADLLATPKPQGKGAGDPGAYLSKGHRDDFAGGCPVAALASETARRAPEARAAMSAGIARMIERQEARGQSREAAVGRVAAMVGAVILSRAVDGALSDELLAATEATLGG